MKYQAYSAYKDSGVEWLGDVPLNWGIIALKRQFRIVGGSTPKSDQEIFWDGEIVWVTPSDLSKLSSLYVADSQRKITKSGLSSCGATLVPKNSIILSTRAPIGSLAITETELCTNQGCKSLVSLNTANTKFFGYLLSISSVELNIRGKGTTFLELSGDELGIFKASVPPISEQQTIANFLDHETAKIDTLIEKQQQLIQLLKEKRQAVISHAVTKGLNPNAPLRDSGVEWLGEVPEHWIVARIKHIVTAIVDGPHFSPSYVEDGYMFISARNIKVDRWSLSDAKYISEKDFTEFNKRIRPEKGDVLLTKGGTTGVARAVDLDFPFQVWVHVAVLKIIQTKVNPFFLAFVLNGTACYEQSQLYTRGATNNDLGLSRIANIFFGLPPMEEQCELVMLLENECKRFDNLISKGIESIDLMQERRTALISAAVTGKIDVRDWQAV